MNNKILLLISIILLLPLISAGVVIQNPLNNHEVLNSLSFTLNISITNSFNSTINWSDNGGISNFTLCTNCTANNWSTISVDRQSYYNLSVYAFNSSGSMQTNTSYNLFVGNRTTYNFNATYQSINMFAYVKNSSSNILNAIHPNTDIDVTASDSLDSIDGNYMMSKTGAGVRTYQLFIANISYNKSLIKSINWSWSGRAEAYGFDVYIWNNTYWNLTSSFDDGNYDDGNHSFYITDISNYVNESNYAHILFREGASYSNLEIYTDYIDLHVKAINSSNSAPTITNVLANNSNFSTSLVNFTMNISDDANFIKNASIYIGSIWNSTITTYYPNSSGNTGFNGTSSVYPPTSINFTNGTSLTSNSLNIISSNDNDFITSPSLGGIVNNGTGVILNYTITDDVSIINNITITARGWGKTYLTTWNFSLFVWSNSTGWKYLTSHNQSTNQTISSTLSSSLSDYLINNQTRFLIITGPSNNLGDFYLYYSNLTVDVKESIQYSLNSSIFNQPINTSINNTFNISINGFADGTYYWYSKACDSDNSCVSSDIRQFTIDTTPPTISIISPISQTYINNIIDYNVSLNENGSWCGYSLSGAGNVTMTKFNDTYFNKSTNTVADGVYTINFYCNDTLGNMGNTTRNFAVDTVPPAITLNYPQTNTFINNKTFFFNYTPYSPIGLGVCLLYGNWSGGWHLNETDSSITNNTINQFNSSGINDGIYFWNVWCNSSIGTTEDWSLQGNQTFTIDTIYPILNITSPRNITYTNNTIDLNFTRSDLNLQSCWYNYNNINETLTSCNNVTFTANQGGSNIILYINDSAGNTNSSNISFWVDSINPSITINTSFSNGSYLNYNNSIKINATINDTNLNTCWYNDNIGTNTTFTCGTNLSLNLSEGLHTIQIWANDTLNNKNSAQISFTPDVTYPIVNNIVTSTTDGSYAFTFSANITDTNLASCKYTIYNSLGFPDGTANKSMSCGSTVADLVSAFASYTLTIYANDSAGNENSTNASFTISAGSGSSSGGGGGAPTTTQNVTLPNFCGNGICKQNFTYQGMWVEKNRYNCEADCAPFDFDEFFYSISIYCFPKFFNLPPEKIDKCFWLNMFKGNFTSSTFSIAEENVSNVCGDNKCTSFEMVTCNKDCDGGFNTNTLYNNCINNSGVCFYQTSMFFWSVLIILGLVLFLSFVPVKYENRKVRSYPYIQLNYKKRRRKNRRI